MTQHDPDLRNLRIEQRRFGPARTDAGVAMEEIIRRLREHESEEAEAEPEMEEEAA